MLILNIINKQDRLIERCFNLDLDNYIVLLHCKQFLHSSLFLKQTSSSDCQNHGEPF